MSITKKTTYSEVRVIIFNVIHILIHKIKHTLLTLCLVQLKNVVQFCSVFSQHSDYSDVEKKETNVSKEG